VLAVAVAVAVVMSTAAQTAKAGESTYCAVRGFIESVRYGDRVLANQWQRYEHV